MEENEVSVAGSSSESHSRLASVDDNAYQGTFTCYLCGLEELYHYKGLNPPFATSVQFLDSSYVMRDPFSPMRHTPTNRKQREVNEPFLVLGSDCYCCEKPVCRDQDCSIFYKHHFCFPCAMKSFDVFPPQIQKKLKCNKGYQ